MPPQVSESLVEAVKQVGFPVVVAGILLWLGDQQMVANNDRLDETQQFITQTLTAQLEKSTAAITAINETLKIVTSEQRQTRAVLANVLNQQSGETAE